MKKFLSLFLMVFILTVGVMFAGCNADKSSYTISANVLHGSLGYVSGGNGTFKSGENIVLTAYPKSNNNEDFICWLFKNQFYSKNRSINITVSKETSGMYLALFKCDNLEYVYLNELNVNFSTPLSQDIRLENLKVSIGNIENILSTIFTAGEINTDSTFNSVLLYPDNKPFAFDKTENIYIKIEATFSRFDTLFISSTSKKIDALTDVAESLSNTTIKLNDPVNPNNVNQIIDENFVAPDISFSFSNFTEYFE